MQRKRTLAALLLSGGNEQMKNKLRAEGEEVRHSKKPRDTIDQQAGNGTAAPQQKRRIAVHSNAAGRNHSESHLIA